MPAYIKALSLTHKHTLSPTHMLTCISPFWYIYLSRLGSHLVYILFFLSPYDCLSLSLPYRCVCVCVLFCMWLYIRKVKLATVVEGDPKATFSIATAPRCTKDATPFLGLLHFTLDMYLIMLSVKQGYIKYHFLSLWYDSTWDWTPVSLAIGKLFGQWAGYWLYIDTYTFIYIYIYICMYVCLHVHLYINVRLCVSMCVYIYIYIYICVCTHRCLNKTIHR